MSFLGTLFFAWWLSCYGLDETLIGGVNEIFGTSYSTNVYWLVAFVVALISGVIELTVYISKKKKH